MRVARVLRSRYEINIATSARQDSLRLQVGKKDGWYPAGLENHCNVLI